MQKHLPSFFVAPYMKFCLWEILFAKAVNVWSNFIVKQRY